MLQGIGMIGQTFNKSSRINMTHIKKYHFFQIFLFFGQFSLLIHEELSLTNPILSLHVPTAIGDISFFFSLFSGFLLKLPNSSRVCSLSAETDALLGLLNFIQEQPHTDWRIHFDQKSESADGQPYKESLQLSAGSSSLDSEKSEGVGGTCHRAMMLLPARVANAEGPSRGAPEGCSLPVPWGFYDLGRWMLRLEEISPSPYCYIDYSVGFRVAPTFPTPLPPASPPLPLGLPQLALSPCSFATASIFRFLSDASMLRFAVAPLSSPQSTVLIIGADWGRGQQSDGIFYRCQYFNQIHAGIASADLCSQPMCFMIKERQKMSEEGGEGEWKRLGRVGWDVC